MFPWVNQAPAWVTAGYSNTLIEEVVTGEEFNDLSKSGSSSDGDFDISSIEDEST
jgi:hypothetical protein